MTRIAILAGMAFAAIAHLIPSSPEAPTVSKKAAAKRARATQIAKAKIAQDTPPSRQVRRAQERAAKKGRANG